MNLPRKIGHLMVASAVVFSFSLVGAGSVAAMGIESQPPGNEVAKDTQAGEAADQATTNDVDDAAEVDADDDQVDADEDEVENVIAVDSGDTAVFATANN